VEDGLTERAAQRQLAQHLKIRLSQPQVHRVMHRLKWQLPEQPELKLKLTVAAYARVSSDSQEAVTEWATH
jgi:hypothetical protein